MTITTTDILLAIREEAYKTTQNESVKLCSAQYKFKDLGMDSIDKIELVMNIENRYGITMTDEEANGISTMADMASLVQMKLEKQAGTGVCQ